MYATLLARMIKFKECIIKKSTQTVEKRKDFLVKDILELLGIVVGS
jgi:hypothetical protein